MVSLVIIYKKKLLTSNFKYFFAQEEKFYRNKLKVNKNKLLMTKSKKNNLYKNIFIVNSFKHWCN